MLLEKVMAHCLLCSHKAQQVHNLCELCQESLPSLPHHCSLCAEFLASQHDIHCGACRTALPPFDKVYALFPYRDAVPFLISALKFHAELQVAKLFSTLFIERITSYWYQKSPLPDLIIPIPLHKERLETRGFNQALEIAKPIAKALRLPLDTTGLIRVRATLAQSGLSAELRKSNVEDAFSVTKTYQARSVALLDDVMTTGHTIRACCALLKQQGASRIDVWCGARRG
jgi:ComF family protein